MFPAGGGDLADICLAGWLLDGWLAGGLVDLVSDLLKSRIFPEQPRNNRHHQLQKLLTAVIVGLVVVFTQMLLQETQDFAESRSSENRFPVVAITIPQNPISTSSSLYL